MKKRLYYGKSKKYENKAAIDYYGEEIENMDEWIIQRNNYCKKLAKEYENNKTN